ncbi:MAG: hypothetical protein ACC662_01165 [Planctomycetota bacterium]
MPPHVLPHRLLAVLAAVLLLGGGSSIARGGEGAVRKDPLPLLPPGLHVGTIYLSDHLEAGSATKQVLDLAFKRCLLAGLKGQDLFAPWDDLEPEPGRYETKELVRWLDICKVVGLRPYLVLGTIDTNNLRVPADLKDPKDPLRLRPGLAFDSPEVVDRFAKLLAVVVPLFVERGGFFLSVGNEVDLFPLDEKGEKAFLGFLDGARRKVRSLEPRLGVGATVTFGGLRRKPAFDAQVLRRSDALAITWYPLDPSMGVRDASVAAGDLDAMTRAAGGKPILLQEIGYPAGWEPKAGNGSSPDAQARFVRNVFAALPKHPQVRFLSWFMLNDFPKAAVDRLCSYYRLHADRFAEYLGTLGMRRADGTSRPAYDAFVEGLHRVSGPPSTSKAK